MSLQSDERIRVYLIAKTRALSYARIRGQDATRKRRVADKGKPKTGKRCSFLGVHLDLIFLGRLPPMLAYGDRAGTREEIKAKSRSVCFP